MHKPLNKYVSYTLKIIGSSILVFALFVLAQPVISGEAFNTEFDPDAFVVIGTVIVSVILDGIVLLILSINQKITRNKMLLIGFVNLGIGFIFMMLLLRIILANSFANFTVSF